MQPLAKRLSIWVVIIPAILIIPLLAQWPWTFGDFVFAIVVLYGSALVYELIARKGGSTSYRAAAGLGVATALVFVWINAAVGIIGNGDFPNTIYTGVLLVGLIGTIISRFQPHGMSRTLFAMATAQMLVPIIALFIWNPQSTSWSPGVVPVFALNAIFALLFVESGLLFKRASRIESKSNCDSKKGIYYKHESQEGCRHNQPRNTPYCHRQHSFSTYTIGQPHNLKYRI